MIYDILEFDSSNIKILNDIETISGKIKVNGVDKFQETSNFIISTSNILTSHSSNYIRSTSNIISNRITNLNADDIANGTTNKYIINNTHPADLTVSGDFTINGTDTTINSILYSSNYVEIINNTPNTAFTITQYDPSNDVFSVLNTTDELLKIKSNGNIGIGTTPSRKLDVNGDINVNGDIKFTGKLYQGDSEFITSYWLKNGNDISISSNVIITGDLSVSGTTATINTDTYTTENLEIINNGTATALSVTQSGVTNKIFVASKSSSQEVFTIANNGKIGINNASPSVSLHITGTDGIVVPVGTEAQRPSNLKGTIRYNDDTSQFEGYGTAWGSLGGVKDIDGDTYITAQGSDADPLADTDKLSFYSGGISRMLIDSNGNVGIGSTITAPTSTLHVGGDIKFTGILYHGDEEFQSSYWEKAGNNELYYTAANVGIGTNNPAQKLHVNGGNIVTSGRIGVGTTSPEQKLHVVGQIVATNKITSFYDYSDERLKTDIKPIEDPLNIIEQLNGFYYKPNELANSFGIESKHRELGLSAQEVKKVLPELVDLAPLDIVRDENDNIVSKSGENYLTVSYDKMIPVIIESIKKLNSEIKLLKEENKLLKESIKKNS